MVGGKFKSLITKHETLITNHFKQMSRGKNKRIVSIYQKFLKIGLPIGRVLLGAVFIFSGFVKAIDPLGSTYKIQDYLRAFGSPFDGLVGLAFTAAVLLSTLELVIGLSLLFNTHTKKAAFLALGFMLVMTPLTLYIALTNPVSDCGCFGDALVISNWATFYKNIFLSALAITLLVFRKRLRPIISSYRQTLAVVIFIGMGLGISIYSYRHLPFIDFLPYKIGVNIPEAMVIPENAISNEYATTFIYAKNGVQKEFTLDNYPKGDPSWLFVDQKSILVKKGYEPPIHDFSILNNQMEDITEDVLYNDNKCYLLTMYDINQTSIEGAKQAEKFYQQAIRNGASFYALTASIDSDIQVFVKKTGVTFPFYKTDPTALKTVIRANPGLVFLKKGTILGKWNWRDFPIEE